MENNIVVKDNALVRAGYHLTLIEQRVILLAVVIARKSNTKITMHTELEVYAHDYASSFDCSLNAAYEALKTAAKTLFERQFSYQEYRKGKLGEFTSRWIYKVGYIRDNACIVIQLAPDVIPLITELEKNFTSYNLLQVKGLTSSYSVRLYELIISWKGTKNYTISLDDLRKTLQLSNEYERVYNLKKRVIEPSIKQINENTDIQVTYTQIKQGRQISHLKFNFLYEKKHKKSFLSFEDWIQKNDLARTGESWSDAKKRLKTDYYQYKTTY